MTVEIDFKAVSAAFSQPESDGTFCGDFAEYLTGIAGRRSVLLFAFAPKCAGTFLRSAAIAATGGQLVRAVHAQGGREAQLYLPTFIHYYYGGICEEPMVVHVHMQAHPANCRFIEALSLKPTVMIRAIPDMLASMWDMFETEPAMRIETVNCIVPPDFPLFSHREKADFMIDMFAPWYVSYFASWFAYAQEQPQTVLLVRFSDFKADPAKTLGQVLEHNGMPETSQICQSAIADTWNERKILRFNKGVEGRGKTYFSEAHCRRLAGMIDRYAVLRSHCDELL